MNLRTPLAALPLLVLAACGGGTPGGPVVDGDGGGTGPAGAWVLVDADPALDVPADTRVTLEVVADGDAWQVGGVAACNSYGGTVVTDGATWRTEGYGATEMGCEPPLMEAERAYLDALVTVDTWERPATDRLVLSSADVELRFDALPPVPTADLTGTTWVLDGLVVGTDDDGSVSSTVATADEATLRLAEDGTVEATTGCRAFSGSWTERGDELVLPEFGQDDGSPNVAADGTTTCDAATVAQEDHVLSVLGDGFRAEVDGPRLTLTSRDGLGLTYRATDG